MKPRTKQGYREKLDLHVLPTLGAIKVRKLHRGAIKTLLATKQSSGLSVDSVRLIHATVRAMLNAAVKDDVIRSRAYDGATDVAAERREKIRALDAEQLPRFVAAAETRTPKFYPPFFLASRTGLRIREALALKWDDLERRELRVARAVSTTGELGTPKSGHGRTVDLSCSACSGLRALRAHSKAEALRQGRQLSEWMFPTVNGKPTPHVTVEAAFKRSLKAAKLPGHFSPHSLRHAYASLLLADGVSPA